MMPSEVKRMYPYTFQPVYDFLSFEEIAECILNNRRRVWSAATGCFGDDRYVACQLVIGNWDVELNIYLLPEYNGSKASFYTEYYLCHKGIDGDWESWDDIASGKECNINWHAPKLAEHLEMQMYQALERFLQKNGYNFSTHVR